jgi:phosphoenolpyruvate carboxykinase (GTP)
MPSAASGGIDTEGLDISDEALNALLAVDPEAWKQQLPQVREHFERFGDKLPSELWTQLEALEERL